MNRELPVQLENLQQRDIETREKLLADGRLYETYDQEMQNVHVENAKALDALVSRHDWPGIAKVGLEGCRAAWLVAQHAICTPALQRKFLNLLGEAAEVGDVPMKQVALLTDRIRFNQGEPQVYRTVLDWNENGELDCGLEDPDRVDQLQAEMGLPPFQESLHEHREEVKTEGGKPPQGLRIYRQAQSKWAKSVGRK